MANQYINKVIYGNRTLIDLTGDTVEAAKVLNGYTAHDKSGAPITGSCAFDVNSTDGTAAVAEILVGKTAYARGTKLTGTMPNNGSVTGEIETVGGEYTIPMGFHDGSGKVGISDTEAEKIVAGNIKAGVDYMEFGYKASKEIFDEDDFGKWKFCNDDDIRAPDSGYDYLSAVTVNAIPYTESDNSAGGVTVTIGG